MNKLGVTFPTSGNITTSSVFSYLSSCYGRLPTTGISRLDEIVSAFTPQATVEFLENLLNDDFSIAKCSSQSYTHNKGFDRMLLCSSEVQGWMLRLHIWYPERRYGIDNPHLHPFHAASTILSGDLDNWEYTYTPRLGTHDQRVLESVLAEIDTIVDTDVRNGLLNQLELVKLLRVGDERAIRNAGGRSRLLAISEKVSWITDGSCIRPEELNLFLKIYRKNDTPTLSDPSRPRPHIIVPQFTGYAMIDNLHIRRLPTGSTHVYPQNVVHQLSVEPATTGITSTLFFSGKVIESYSPFLTRAPLPESHRTHIPNFTPDQYRMVLNKYLTFLRSNLL